MTYFKSFESYAKIKWGQDLTQRIYRLLYSMFFFILFNRNVKFSKYLAVIWRHKCLKGMIIFLLDIQRHQRKKPQQQSTFQISRDIHTQKEKIPQNAESPLQLAFLSLIFSLFSIYIDRFSFFSLFPSASPPKCPPLLTESVSSCVPSTVFRHYHTKAYYHHNWHFSFSDPRKKYKRYTWKVIHSTVEGKRQRKCFL